MEWWLALARRAVLPVIVVVAASLAAVAPAGAEMRPAPPLIDQPEHFDDDPANDVRWTPDRLAVTRDGTRLYAPSIVDPDRIYVFDNGGERIAIWGPADDPEADVTVELGGWGDIAVDAGGNVWLLDRGPRIRKFSPAGELLELFDKAPGGAGDGEIAPDFTFKPCEECQPYSETTATAILPRPDGGFYVADAGNRRVQQFDADGEFVRKWVLEELFEERDDLPEDLARSPNGDVIVLTHSGDIGRLTTVGDGFRRPIFTSPDDEHPMFPGLSLEADGAGFMWVVANLGQSIQRIGPDGTYLERFEMPGDPNADGDRETSKGIAIDDTGHIHVSRFRDVVGLKDESFVPVGSPVAPPPGGTVTGLVQRQGPRRGTPDEPAPDALVEICKRPVDGRACLFRRAGEDGAFRIDNLDAGTYSVRVNPPGPVTNHRDIATELTLSDETGATLNLVLPLTSPWPPDSGIGPIVCTSVPCPPVDEPPVVPWNTPTLIRWRADPGCVVNAVIQFYPNPWGQRPGDIQLQLRPDPATYDANRTVVFSALAQPVFPNWGVANTRFDEICTSFGGRSAKADAAEGDANPPEWSRTVKCQDCTVYFAPSGIVLDTAGAPVEGATVTLQQEAGGVFAAVPSGSDILSPFNRSNPSGTDAGGRFAWDPLAGTYKIRAEKQGCHKPGDPGVTAVETDALVLPPLPGNLELRLECPTPAPPPGPDRPPGTDPPPGSKPPATSPPPGTTPPARTARPKAPSLKVVRRRGRLLLQVRANLPQAVAGRTVVIERARGRRALRLAQVRLGPSGRLRRDIRLQPAKKRGATGIKGARRLQVRLRIEATSSALEAVGPYKSVRTTPARRAR